MTDQDCSTDGICLRSYGADYAGSPHHRAHQERAMTMQAEDGRLVPAPTYDRCNDCGHREDGHGTPQPACPVCDDLRVLNLSRQSVLRG